MASPLAVRQTLVENISKVWPRDGDKPLSQAAFARRAGLNQTAVNRLMDIDRYPALDPQTGTIEKIARALGVPSFFLYIPELPADMLSRPDLRAFCEQFRAASPEVRDAWMQMFRQLQNLHR